MPTISELLPFLRGVEEKFWVRVNEVLNPGQYIQWEATRKGWTRAVVVTTNNKYMWFEHNLFEAPQRYTPYHIYMMGLVRPTITNVWLSRYDETNNLYTLLLTLRPLPSFKQGFYYRVTAPDTDPLTGAAITTPTVIYSFAVETVEVFNEKEFKESLLELIEGEK